jgi:hypothetical protein
MRCFPKICRCLSLDGALHRESKFVAQVGWLHSIHRKKSNWTTQNKLLNVCPNSSLDVRLSKKRTRAEALKKKIGSQNYRERSPGSAENLPGKKVANLIMNRRQQDRSNLDGGILKYNLIEIKAKSLMKSAVLYLRNDRFGSKKWQNVLKNSQKVTKSDVCT